MYDLIIKNGEIVDGCGNEPYFADIAVKDGKIIKIAAGITDPSVKTVDATGLTVTPGFIDSHSHADSAVITHPMQKEKIEQGITTAIAGMCGTSSAPLPIYHEKSDEIEYPGIGTNTEICKTMSSYLKTTRNIPQGCNIAMFVGHSALRKAAMGMANRKPTPDELEKMKELVRDAMDAGAYGMSIGLYYTPGNFSDEHEIIELAKVVAEKGGVLSAHIRGEGDSLIESSEEFLRIVKASGVRGVHSHIKASNERNFGKVKTVLEMIGKANEEGFEVYCDVYPYIAAATSLSASFVPPHMRADRMTIPTLTNPESREMAKQIKRAAYNTEPDFSWVLVTYAKNRPDVIGKRVNEIAKERGCDVFDAVYDIIVDSGDNTSACYFSMSEEDVETAIQHPRAMICTDSGVSKGKTVYHPRLRASFPRAIGRYARDGKLLPLTEIIRKTTSLPAYVYGLQGKGQIKEGFDADICIFDKNAFIDKADFTNCTIGCEGLNYVIVSGEIAAENAIQNDKRLGKVLMKSSNT